MEHLKFYLPLYVLLYYCVIIIIIITILSTVINYYFFIIIYIYITLPINYDCYIIKCNRCKTKRTFLHESCYEIIIDCFNRAEENKFLYPLMYSEIYVLLSQ